MRSKEETGWFRSGIERDQLWKCWGVHLFGMGKRRGERYWLVG